MRNLLVHQRHIWAGIPDGQWWARDLSAFLSKMPGTIKLCSWPCPWSRIAPKSRACISVGLLASERPQCTPSAASVSTSRNQIYSRPHSALSKQSNREVRVAVHHAVMNFCHFIFTTLFYYYFMIMAFDSFSSCLYEKWRIACFYIIYSPFLWLLLTVW